MPILSTSQLGGKYRIKNTDKKTHASVKRTRRRKLQEVNRKSETSQNGGRGLGGSADDLKKRGGNHNKWDKIRKFISNEKKGKGLLTQECDVRG